MEITLSDKLDNTKLFFGPMSKNIVDAVINNGSYIGLIASRRQIDHAGGYVNNWTTRTFVEYVRSRTDKVLICRDHGGIGQGEIFDDGLWSLWEDIALMDIVHIDPWKVLEFKPAVEYTVKVIEKGYEINPDCLYEVGTEQAIYDMNPHLFYHFISELKSKLGDKFKNIIFGVIQSGTSLKAGLNTGMYSEDRLQLMNNVCKRHWLKSKEHNGDYLPASLVKQKFNLGLDAINIAPEIANLETKHILEKISDKNKWFDLVIKDGHWKKWFPSDFNPKENINLVLNVCGHYVLSRPDFTFDLNLVKDYVQAEINSFISERYG